MKADYLFILRSKDYASIYPCDVGDLKHALKDILSIDYLKTWPGHGHGAEWRLVRPDKTPDYGVMVLDLIMGGTIMTIDELKALDVWPE